MTAAVVFLAAILVITLIEFGTGKPIGSSLSGQKATGTPVGNVSGGTSNKSTVQPTTPATPGQSARPARAPAPA